MDDVFGTANFEATAARWTQAAPQLGFGPNDHKLHLVRARMNDQHQRVVVLAQGQGGAPDLIVKHSLSGQAQRHFDNGVAAHRRAVDVFSNVDLVHVPALLHVDPDIQFIVMEAAKGQTAHDLLAEHGDVRATVLQACGAWMGHWHRSTFERPNPINPNTMQKTLKSLRDSVADHKRPVVGRRAFLACADVVFDMAEAARGQITTLAATHGDMNLRNFIIGPNGTYGIDFGAIHTAPIGHDLARFVANFANFFYPENAEDRDGQWLSDDLTAFFEGYGPEARNDPSFQYLLRMQIMKDWANIPKDIEHRNALHRHRMAGIQLLTTILF